MSNLSGSKLVSGFKYPRGFWLGDMRSQLELLDGLVPGMRLPGRQAVSKLPEVPNGFEQFAVIPTHEALAKQFLVSNDWPVFSKALGQVIGLMRTKFEVVHNYCGHSELARSGEIEGFELRRLRLTNRTPADFKPHARWDVHILPVQMGKRFAGLSPYEADEFCGPHEFLLDAAQVGVLLMYAERYIYGDTSLHLHAGASRLCIKGDGESYSETLCWNIESGEVNLDWNAGHRARGLYASPSALAMPLAI